jgi:hypothetical protein
MKPYTTLKRDDVVVVWRRAESQLSNVSAGDIGKMFTVKVVEYDGRHHNKYISSIFLRGKDGKEIRACIDELARCNPNFEPEGEYIVCIGCGAAVADIDLKIVKHLDNIKSCPACGILEPTSS